mmetsp:Transcript_22219/g.26681  ORF Transcript_22219/g.26681 Transcript_22219/m.26681 type:complete len:212 (-) Transcript_22219:289-924(-)
MLAELAEQLHKGRLEVVDLALRVLRNSLDDTDARVGDRLQEFTVHLLVSPDIIDVEARNIVAKVLVLGVGTCSPHFLRLGLVLGHRAPNVVERLGNVRRHLQQELEREARLVFITEDHVEMFSGCLDFLHGDAVQVHNMGGHHERTHSLGATFFTLASVTKPEGVEGSRFARGELNNNRLRRLVVGGTWGSDSLGLVGGVLGQDFLNLLYA